MRSYHRFFQAVYRDKYFYMGEQDLLTASFLLDTAQYYLFVVMPAYKLYGKFHWMPVLGPGGAGLNYALMKLYNRRFKALALARRRVGEEGRRNDGRRVKPYFAFGLAPLRMAARGLRFWALAELDGLRLLLKRRWVRAPASAEAERLARVRLAPLTLSAGRAGDPGSRPAAALPRTEERGRAALPAAPGAGGSRP